MERIPKPESRKVNPKSPELMQAQMAAFAAEHVKDFRDRKHLFNNLHEFSSSESSELKRIAGEHEYRDGEEGLERVPAGTELTIATKKGYLDFLRSIKGTKYEGIQERAKILEAYKEFAPEVEKLKSRLEVGDKKKAAEFLGNGANSVVFKLEHGGKQYAVRIPSRNGVDPMVIDSHLAGAVLGKDIPHLEQIIAASYEDGVTVAEIMPGKLVGDLTLEEIQHISDAQLSEFIDTLSVVSDRGIEIDPKPSNFFYDPEVGFGIVDYHSSKVQKNSADQNFGTVVGWMQSPLTAVGLHGKPYVEKTTPKDYALELEFYKAGLEVLMRYREIVLQKLTDADLQSALNMIDGSIKSLKELIDNYSNPEWVSEQVATTLRFIEQRKNNSAGGSTSLTF